MCLPIFYRPTGTATSKYCLGRRLLCMASLTLLLGYPAIAQNAPTPASIPTGDEVLYAHHAGCWKKGHGQQLTQCPCLSHRELRLKRHQYVNQHRNEFPAIYQPGVE
jgi:hypothetical protein